MYGITTFIWLYMHSNECVFVSVCVLLCNSIVCVHWSNYHYNQDIELLGQVRGLTSATPATQEAEMGKIKVGGHWGSRELTKLSSQSINL
jgi:hypothetical protein